MTLAFCATGAGLLLLALALRRAVPGARVAPALLGLAGVLHLVDAAFPTDARGVPPTTHGLIHNLAGLGIFVLLPIAMVAAGRAFRAHPAWRSFSHPTLVWGGVALVGLLVLLLSGGVDRFGAGQRFGVATWFSWLLVLAWRVRQADSARAAGTVPVAPVPWSRRSHGGGPRRMRVPSAVGVE